jgi:dTDP-4-amino-4,6-dideoxygalactose transaminase
LSNVLAGIGRAQLKVLDERVKRKRQILELSECLLGGLPGVHFMPKSPNGRCNRWLTVMLIDAELRSHKRGRSQCVGSGEHRIQAHLEADATATGFRGMPRSRRGGKRALFRDGLCLPSGTAMTDSDVERVAGVVRRCVGARQSEIGDRTVGRS